MIDDNDILVWGFRTHEQLASFLEANTAFEVTMEWRSDVDEQRMGQLIQADEVILIVHESDPSWEELVDELSMR